MKVLGLATEEDSGAVVVENGRVLAAVNEERLSRMKLVVGFPHGAIRAALQLANTALDELDAVLIGSTKDAFVGEQLEPFDGWFQYHPEGLSGWLKTCAAPGMAPLGKYLPFADSIYYALLAPAFVRRRRAIRRILRQDLGLRCPIKFVDHHFAHVTSAYFTSGFKDALVVSLDGGGDGKCGVVYAVRDGHIELVQSLAAYHSLGNYYAYITHICGFKAHKHEGKITGLAAHGEPIYVDLLNGFITERNGAFQNRGGVHSYGAIRALERRLPNGWRREDLAASIQRHFEDLTVRFVRHWARRTGLRDVALAGGVFANVRVNQEVYELPEVDRIFIHPHMTDGGLGGGAALAACVDGVLEETMLHCDEPLRDVYFGTDLTEQEIEAALKDHGLRPERLHVPLEEKVADLLAEGYVVARAAGRMEYGPRALGNRSILYQPTDPTVNDWLNENLHRTEFMPFAPAALFEERHRMFENVAGAQHAAEFMTITFDCTPWMREQMPGVVHVDGTARPQLVRRDRNAGFYRIIEAFYQRTGLPAVINTSFNMHEEPIVCTADDCVRAFIDGNLDYLAVGPHLVKHPRSVTHRVSAVGLVQQDAN
jgi:carbamoyltransferase